MYSMVRACEIVSQLYRLRDMHCSSHGRVCRRIRIKIVSIYRNGCCVGHDVRSSVAGLYYTVQSWIGHTSVNHSRDLGILRNDPRHNLIRCPLTVRIVSLSCIIKVVSPFQAIAIVIHKRRLQ